MGLARTLRKNWLIVAVIAAQLCDTLTFLPAVARVGIDAEHNVLVRHLYLSFGPVGPVLLKIVAILIVLAALGWIRARFPARLGPVVAIVVAAGLFGAWSNVAYGLIA